MEPAPSLELFPEKSTLSEIAATVAANYGKYHGVTAQLEALQEWAQGVGKPSGQNARP